MVSTCKANSAWPVSEDLMSHVLLDAVFEVLENLKLVCSISLRCLNLDDSLDAEADWFVK